MKLLRNVHGAAAIPEQGTVATIGNFDGVHRGHGKVIDDAREIATGLVAPLGVMAFEPHPREFFAPDAPSFRLTSASTRARLLDRHGVDLVFALPFTRELATQDPEAFVEEVLVAGVGVAHVVVGYDFCFGKARKGDAALLRKMGKALGFGVTVIEAVTSEGDDEIYSSTRIRDALRDGCPAEAARLLGHWWTIEGEVKQGDQRGRTIGFPTANIQMGRYLHPAHGVYAVKIEVRNGPHAGTYDGVANLGRRPTFDKSDVLFEVFLFDFEGDLYGAELAVSLIGFIRAEQKFDGLDALKAQIAKDSDAASSALDKMKASPQSPPWTE